METGTQTQNGEASSEALAISRVRSEADELWRGQGDEEEQTDSIALQEVERGEWGEEVLRMMGNSGDC